MPTYDYRCEACSQVITVERSIADQLAREPYCDNCLIPAKRIWSPTPAVFKGTGWGGQK